MSESKTENKIVTMRRSYQRCDYIVTFEGVNYWVWAKNYNDGSVNLHIKDSDIEPDFKLERRILKYLESEKKGDPCYEKCFGCDGIF